MGIYNLAQTLEVNKSKLSENYLFLAVPVESLLWVISYILNRICLPVLGQQE